MELVRDSLERTNREQQRSFYPIRLTVIVSLPSFAADVWNPGRSKHIYDKYCMDVLPSRADCVDGPA
jgi:hypothetical protein